MIVVMTLIYLYAGFSPFRWQPPRKVRNRGEFTSEGTLRFQSAGLAQTRATPAWLENAVAENQLDVHLRVRPFASTHGVIMTISRDMSRCNLRIRQVDEDLVVRMRAPGIADGGEDLIRFPKLLSPSDKFIDVDLSVRSGLLRVQCSGTEIRTARLPEDAMQNWNLSYCMALGNEPTGSSPWLGEFGAVEVTVGDTKLDYLATRQLVLPEHYWSIYMKPRWLPFAQFDWDGDSVMDCTTNFLGFLPFGFMVAMLVRRKKVVFTAVLATITLSTLIELMQLGFVGRFTSTTDWLLNVSGGALGALAAGVFRNPNSHIVKRLGGTLRWTPVFGQVLGLDKVY